MRWSKHSLPALAIAALLAAGSALAPNVAAAQGNSHKNKTDKELARQARREARAVRYDDDRWDDRWDDRRRDRDGRRWSYANVPPGHMPPAGMCRIWIDGVPPGRQPRPTSCAYAERNRPANARVIYGSNSRARYDDVRRDDGGWRRDDDGVWRRRGSDGVWRDEQGRTRADVLHGRRADGSTCFDLNRDGRCDF